MARTRARRGRARHTRLLEEAQALAHVGSWEWDLETGSLTWTAESYRIFGVDPSSFVPTVEGVVGLIHEDDRLQLGMAVAESVHSKQPYKCVVRIRQPSAEIRWVETVGVPSVVAGAIVTFTGTVLDITERRLGELRLQYSEARLAEAQRLARLGTWSYDVQAKELSCADEIYRVIGVEPALGIASFGRFMLLVHPDDRGRAEAFVAAVQEDLIEACDELRIVTPTGDQRWLALRTAPVRDAQGRITEMRGTLQDISERKESEEHLARLAVHDQLTGLPNRALFIDRLEQAVAREDSALSVIVLDLDGLKAINDSLGHAAGDELLVAVAERLRDALRPSQTVARFGGGEFTVLIDQTDDEAAVEVGERLLRAVSLPIPVDGRNVSAQASVGVAGGAGSGEHLLQDAYAAMYVAKQRGGGRVELFDASFHASTVERRSLECDLRTAELGREMVLHYQPLFDLRDGRLAGFEALLRWNHPTRGPISPAEFVPVAEQSGSIVTIGRWVVEEACRQAQTWNEHHPMLGRLRMNVNISARQLVDREAETCVGRALAESGLDPDLLTLEITETMIMADEDEVAMTLGRLKELGVRISVDDFGTGYSSLGHLNRFPIDELKIDRSFVERLGTEGADCGVALAVVHLAQNLSVEVVAEGIEREDQLVLLRNAGCGLGQGYLLARPLDVAGVERLLSDGPHLALPPDTRPVILVVDDEDGIRHSTARVLAQAGYDVVDAATGEAALDIARRRAVDAVVLDIHLPDLSGHEVCRRLRESSDRHVAVLELSGSATTVDERVRGLELGADAFLTKPVDPTELVATLRAILRSAVEARPLAAVR